MTELRLALALPLVSFLLILGACAPPTAVPNPENPYATSQSPQVGEILHLPTGVAVTEAQMLTVVGDSRIVYVGETHDNPASHRQELALLRYLADRYPGKFALGMEMFVPSQQPVLDRWTAGELSEKEFLKGSRWYETWRMDFDYYRELLEFARDHRIPVIGLNAEQDLVDALREQSPAELSDEQRQRLPQMDMTDPYHSAMLEAILGDHVKLEKHGAEMMESFHRVQTLWDETMAESIVRYLKEPKQADFHLLVVAGGNHVRYGFGIPRRVFRRLPLSYTLIGSDEIVIPPDKQDRLMDVKKPGFPMPPYDFILFTKYEDLGKQEVRLGVLLNEAEGGVKVDGVVPDSPGAVAGLQKGDGILAIDGLPVTENFDLVYEIKHKRPGDRSVLSIRRGEQKLSLEVEFTVPTAGDPHDFMKN